MELWNVKELPVPPVTVCPSPKKIDVNFLKKTLTEGYDFYSEQPELASEAAVLSRVIYRMKLKFRSSKDFKSLERLNHGLLNYLHLKLPILLRNFNHLVPNSYKVNLTNMPSKNLVDYILIRLQGLGKLLWRILESCKIASEFAGQRMRLGHFWKVALITYGLVARIFVILKNMIKFTCDLYSNLRPFSFKLAYIGAQWLPDDYNLPESLSDWLNIDWLDLENTIIEIPDEVGPTITSYFNLIDDSDDDEIIFSDQYILINDEDNNFDNSVEILENKPIKVEEDKKLILKGFSEEPDIGEAIEIENPDESVIFVNQTTPEFIPVPSESKRGKKRQLDEPKLSKNAKRRKKLKISNQNVNANKVHHNVHQPKPSKRSKQKQKKLVKQMSPSKKHKKRYFNNDLK